MPARDGREGAGAVAIVVHTIFKGIERVTLDGVTLCARMLADERRSAGGVAPGGGDGGRGSVGGR